MYGKAHVTTHACNETAAPLVSEDEQEGYLYDIQELSSSSDREENWKCIFLLLIHAAYMHHKKRSEEKRTDDKIQRLQSKVFVDFRRTTNRPGVQRGFQDVT